MVGKCDGVSVGEHDGVVRGGLGGLLVANFIEVQT